MKNVKEKNIEYHMIKTRCILWYVRDFKLLEELKCKVKELERNINRYAEDMTNEDLIISQYLISSNLSIDTILEFQDRCRKENIHQYGKVI